ncbi:hypothetical protein COT52_02575 [candidate division WWE3 bacterium CG08_land_8_20_14_0_20_43_13]|uniref:Glycosyltransferase RgtA/B/C/D-like domain-containing protein n=1 Tax=candidate division WWE3 bacterium CG08_land_8_20_14_0_20_43_13 TaxID=1975087 RepID=A0A2H0X6W1_UNCKA|nr:MAG: hypothetical protein COT52_02575 [candidate division WWE3 bacterium CG08_land_8_20_14_0_20_43_13]
MVTVGKGAKINQFGVFLVFTLILLSLAKIYRLDGAVVLGDPDEWTHWEVAKSFSTSVFPSFSGGAWYYSLPLFPALGFLVNLLGRWWPVLSLDHGFVSLRLVSVISSLALALGIFFYLRQKAGVWAGFGGAVVWCLHPFATHFSRLGLLEVPVTALCFLSFFAYDWAVCKKSKLWAILSGLLLGLAILTKYTALILFFFYFLLLFFSWIVGVWKRRYKQFIFTFSLVRILPLFVSGFMVLPVLAFYYLNDPVSVKIHTLVNLISWERFTGARLWVGENYFKLGSGLWWVGWPLLLLTVVGLFLALISKHRRQFYSLGFFCLFSSISVVIREPFYPRYFLFLLPFFAIFSGLVFGWLVDKRGKIGLVLCLVVIGLLLPGFKNGLNSSYSLILKNLAYGSFDSGFQYLFSNYWPHIVGQNSFACATWLAEESGEVQAFCSKEKRLPSQILNEEGGLIVLESDYSSAYISPVVSRTEAVKIAREAKKPDKIVGEEGSNYPYFKKFGRRLEVYEVKK